MGHHRGKGDPLPWGDLAPHRRVEWPRGGSGVGLGEGLAGQLLAFQANKPILDRILKEAGFTGDANAVESLLAGIAAKPDGKALPEPQSKPIIAGGANIAADGAKRGAP